MPFETDSDHNDSIDPNDVLFFHHSESTNQILFTQNFNGDNYPQWRRSAEISLMARNKLGLVDGTCTKLKTDSSKLANLERYNNLIICWLIHSLEPEISFKTTMRFGKVSKIDMASQMHQDSINCTRTWLH